MPVLALIAPSFASLQVKLTHAYVHGDSGILHADGMVFMHGLTTNVRLLYHVADAVTRTRWASRRRPLLLHLTSALPRAGPRLVSSDKKGAEQGAPCSWRGPFPSAWQGHKLLPFSRRVASPVGWGASGLRGSRGASLLSFLGHAKPDLVALATACRLAVAVDHFREQLSKLTLIVPRQRDVPLVRHALRLVEEQTGMDALSERAFEYNPDVGAHAETLHVIGWRQEAAPDDPDQNDLWSDFLPTQVRGVGGWGWIGGGEAACGDGKRWWQDAAAHLTPFIWQRLSYSLQHGLRLVREMALRSLAQEPHPEKVIYVSRCAPRTASCSSPSVVARPSCAPPPSYMSSFILVHLSFHSQERRPRGDKRGPPD